MQRRNTGAVLDMPTRRQSKKEAKMTTLIKTVAATSCLFFVLGTGAPASELTGTVRDVCGPVLPGTAVSVASQSGAAARVAADGEGRSLFKALDPGQWTITFKMPGFQTEQQDIRIPQNGDAVQHNVRLLPDPSLKQEFIVTHGDPNLRYRQYSVHGVVRGRSGEPISAATVRLRDVGSGKSRGSTSPCTADESGRYALSAWSPTATRWRLSVEAEGFRPYTHPDVELTPDEPRVIELRLEKR
jgi:hypothetical protein